MDALTLDKVLAFICALSLIIDLQIGFPLTMDGAQYKDLLDQR